MKGEVHQRHFPQATVVLQLLDDRGLDVFLRLELRPDEILENLDGLPEIDLSARGVLQELRDDRGAARRLRSVRGGDVDGARSDSGGGGLHCGVPFLLTWFWFVLPDTGYDSPRHDDCQLTHRRKLCDVSKMHRCGRARGKNGSPATSVQNAGGDNPVPCPPVPPGSCTSRTHLFHIPAMTRLIVGLAFQHLTCEIPVADLAEVSANGVRGGETGATAHLLQGSAKLRRFHATL